MHFNGIKNQIIQWDSKDYIFYKTALFLAVEKENIDIVKVLLMNDKIDVNICNIYYLTFL